jgi:hypothetical protein
MVSRDRVAGPDTTTNSVSHKDDDLRIRLPDPENPLKHFFITNLFDIPQVPVPVLRGTRQLDVAGVVGVTHRVVSGFDANV